MSMITVTDKVGTSGTVTVDKDDVAEAIRPWYPEAPAEVTEAIDNLQAALNQDDRAARYELEAHLGIEITR